MNVTHVQTMQHVPKLMEAIFVRVRKASLEVDSTVPVSTLVLYLNDPGELNSIIRISEYHSMICL